jgi:hypothetical protein
MTLELLALANYRKALRGEIARHAERLRSAQIEALSGRLAQYGFGGEPAAAVTAIMLMSSISRFLVMEQALGMSSGHAETVALVERHLTRLEGKRRRARGVR